MIKKFSARYDQLAQEAISIESSKKREYSEFTGSYYSVDRERVDEWRVKAKSLVSKTCGDESEHIKSFREAEKPQSYEDDLDYLKRLRSVFMAAKDDFQGGYLSSVKDLVQAELFESELEQATALLETGYKGPAAVVAGVVLETSLKELCSKHGISHAKLDKMNADLTKAGVYSGLQQKRITALADIRNKGAHGDWESFSNDDVEMMIRDIENFLLAHIS